MTLINSLLTNLFNIIFAPFRGLDPVWAMAFISLVAGVIMLWIFGKTSNQKAIAAVKNKISGNLLAVRLFQDDIGVVLRTNARILRYTGIYFMHSMVPMVFMIVPVMLILIQLNLNFAMRPFHEGEKFLLEVKLRDADVLHNLENIKIELPDGVVVDPPFVREFGDTPSVTWELTAEGGNGGEAVVHIGDEEVRKKVQVGEKWTAVPMKRTGENLWEQLLWPGEPAIPASSNIKAVEVGYPEQELSVFGFNVNWLVLFFILSLVFGFAFKDLLGVKI